MNLSRGVLANNMTIAVVMVILVNDAVGEENRAAGQVTYITVERVVSLIVGNLFGGMLSKALGIRPVFLVSVLINVAGIAAFVAISKKKARAL